MITDDKAFVTALLDEEGVAAMYPGHFRIFQAFSIELAAGRLHTVGGSARGQSKAASPSSDALLSAEWDSGPSC